AHQMRADLALLQAGKSVKRLRNMERQFTRLKRASIVGAGRTLLVAAAYVGSLRESRQTAREARHAKLAEQNAKEKLWDSYLAQAQARRWSGRVGRRFESLEVIK